MLKYYTNTTDDLIFQQYLNLVPYKLETWLKSLDKDSKYFFRVLFNFSTEITIDNLYVSLAQKRKNFFLVIDFSFEAYATSSFKLIYEFVQKYKLYNKVIFLTAHLDAENEYKEWLKENNLKNTFFVYSFNKAAPIIRQFFIDNNFNFETKKTKWYCCLNHRPHPHRLTTITYLDYFDLIKDGIVSCHDRFYENDEPDMHGFRDYIDYGLENSTDYYANILKNQIPITEKKLPLVFDIKNVKLSTFEHTFKMSNSIYGNSLINLITETFYFKRHNLLSDFLISEKTYKPILAKQVFILIGPRGLLQYLKDCGFKTFSDFFDESYDLQPDNVRQYKAIETLHWITNNYTIDQLDSLTKEIRDHNFNHFMSFDFKIDIFNKLNN